MSTWHIGVFFRLGDTRRAMIATTPTEKRAADDSVVGLIEAYRDRGDRRAIERLLSMHARLLNHLVGRYAACSEEPYEDLHQVGYVGLMKAVNGYRLDSEAKFSSYAYSMIEGEIKHHLRDTALVKKPRWARSLHARVTEATTRLTAELGRPPLVEEVAAEVNITPEGVSELMKLFCDTDVMSLDAGGGRGGRCLGHQEPPLRDLLAAGRGPHPARAGARVPERASTQSRLPLLLQGPLPDGDREEAGALPAQDLAYRGLGRQGPEGLEALKGAEGAGSWGLE